ncbi:MAG: hypothetical protein FWG28_03945 [Clostridiales bacterium]|nr:hypothetical protein [Clostridiales bacterium]
MRPSLSLKTLFRSPARTILTFVLLGLASFAFFVQAGGYAVTRREFNRAALEYRGVGAAEATPPYEPTSIMGVPPKSVSMMPYYLEANPRVSEHYTDEERDVYHYTYASYPEEVRYQPLTREQIAAVSGLSYLAVSDVRYMTAGLSDDYRRLDDGVMYYIYPRCIVEATLMGVNFAKQVNVISRADFISLTHLTTHNVLGLEDRKILAGDCLYIAEHDCFPVEAISAPPVDVILPSGAENRPYYYLKPNFAYGSDYFEALATGQRYVFVVQFMPNSEITSWP